MKRKKQVTGKKLQLQSDWEKLIAKHSKPLERGAKAHGIVVTGSGSVVAATVPRPSSINSIPSLRTSEFCTTIPIESSELIQVKRNLSSRTGQAWNKGGVQYLTDLDIEEQKTGSHRRRS